MTITQDDAPDSLNNNITNICFGFMLHSYNLVTFFFCQILKLNIQKYIFTHIFKTRETFESDNEVFTFYYIFQRKHELGEREKTQTIHKNFIGHSTGIISVVNYFLICSFF